MESTKTVCAHSERPKARSVHRNTLSIALAFLHQKLLSREAPFRFPVRVREELVLPSLVEPDALRGLNQPFNCREEFRFPSRQENLNCCRNSNAARARAVAALRVRCSAST